MHYKFGSFKMYVLSPELIRTEQCTLTLNRSEQLITSYNRTEQFTLNRTVHIERNKSEQNRF